jgi:hypothetical protein
MIRNQVLARRIAISFWILLTVYVGLYLILSLFGAYSALLSRSGTRRFAWGMAVSDVREWQPYGVMKYSDRHNLLGVIFAPLVDIDRRFWHKPKDALPLVGTMSKL